MYTPKNLTAEPLRYRYLKGEPKVRRSEPGPCVAALISLAVTLLFGLTRLADATTINASSASESDVAAAISSGTNGDSIAIPAGTATWTHTLSIKKAIELRGAGIGNTIIKDGVQSGQTISVVLVPGKVTRLTGIEFQDGGRPDGTGAAPTGVFRIDGSNMDGSQLRWDHCKFDNLNGFFVPDTVIGVFDHNIVMIGQKGGTPEFMYPYAMRWNGGSYGDGSWAAPAGWGSSQFLFVEDNTFINSNPTYQGYFTDGFGGARVVVRHNISSGGMFSNHGTESAGRIRSARAFEIYKNNISCNNLNRFPGGSRGGSTLFHDNTITKCGGEAAQFNLDAYRMFNEFAVFGGADGTNGWDKQSPRNPFYSGTVSATGANTISVADNPWASNQWQGYTIKRGAGGMAYITGNTPNTLTFANGLFGTQPFKVGDAFVINKVDQSLDQPGVGLSKLIRGDSPTPPANWNQVAEPCYSWGNTNDGVPFNNFNPNESNIKASVNFFNNTVLPGYTEFTYPHPLVTGNPLPSGTPDSPAVTRTSLRRPWGGKKKEETREFRKPRRKAKENSRNGTTDGQENLNH